MKLAERGQELGDILTPEIREQFGWNWSELSVDLPPLQKALLKRALSNKSSLSDLAAHFGISAAKTQRLLAQATSKISRFQKQNGKAADVFRPLTGRPICCDCQSPMKNFSHDEICDRCHRKCVRSSREDVLLKRGVRNLFSEGEPDV